MAFSSGRVHIQEQLPARGKPLVLKFDGGLHSGRRLKTAAEATVEQLVRAYLHYPHTVLGIALSVAMIFMRREQRI
jgi:hypothetical protein